MVAAYEKGLFPTNIAKLFIVTQEHHMIMWLHENHWNPSYLFDYADDNKDGVVTLEEVKKQVTADWYVAVDTAFTNAKQMLNRSSSSASELTKAEMSQLFFMAIDTGKNEMIDENEFEAALRKLADSLALPKVDKTAI